MLATLFCHMAHPEERFKQVLIIHRLEVGFFLIFSELIGWILVNFKWAVPQGLLSANSMADVWLKKGLAWYLLGRIL